MTEKEREALMRLTMCARNECVMCKYKDSCDSDVRFEFATKHMNILADALRKTENSSEIPNNWEDFFREPTAEERKAVADYIDSISVPTGVNVYNRKFENGKKGGRPKRNQDETKPKPNNNQSKTKVKPNEYLMLRMR